jgi:NTP pyrophosphatase (non-canonical NTP hydrolase)
VSLGQEERDRDQRIFKRGQAAAGLTFTALHEANVSRARRWHPGFPEDDDWNGADWSNAMCGEAGEAANVVKKLRRVESGKRGRTSETSETDQDQLVAKLALEIADLVIYADLLAAKYGIDLACAIRDKFNAVSIQYGFPEELPA